MNIDRIGFGYCKNLGGYENCKVYMEASVETWEDPAQSLELLRNRVAEELDLPDGWHNLRFKYNQKVAALRNTENSLQDIQQKLAKAKEKWVEYKNFLVAHGVNPESLEIDGSSGSPLVNLTRALKLQKLCTKCVESDNLVGFIQQDFTGFIQEVRHILNETPVLVGNEYDDYFANESHSDPDYFDPYHGDEYDRLHNQVDDEPSEYSDL